MTPEQIAIQEEVSRQLAPIRSSGLLAKAKGLGMVQHKPTRKYKNNPSCYYCGSEFGPLQARYIVQEAVKPTKTPYRWVQIGSMCEDCNIAGKPSHYDKYITPVELYNDTGQSPVNG